MFKEEYDYPNIREYLNQKIDLLIGGIPGVEERSWFFFNEIQNNKKDMLLFRQNLNDSNLVDVEYYQKGVLQHSQTTDLVMGIPRVLRYHGVFDKSVLLDLSSLEHVLLMYITKVLIQQVVPKLLFASYIRPNSYIGSRDDLAITLTNKILGVNSVPGFSKREKEWHVLCAFIGFEGVRLKGIIEATNNIEKLIPIIAFPSTALHWYNVTMWNNMDPLSDSSIDYTVHKCFSESIFEAVNLLNEILPQYNDRVILAPIGTRTHSIACAIYACYHPEIKIIFDYAVENQNRSQGIFKINIYHLSSFLKT